MISATEISKLQSIQNKCIATLSPVKDPTEIFKREWILNINELIQLSNCKLVYKLLNNLLPQRLTDAFATDSKNRSLKKTHSYNTRRKHIPNVPSCNHHSYHNSFLVASLRDYQSLPVITQHCKSIQSFVANCKNHIFSDK